MTKTGMVMLAIVAIIAMNARAAEIDDTSNQTAIRSFRKNVRNIQRVPVSASDRSITVESANGTEKVKFEVKMSCAKYICPVPCEKIAYIEVKLAISEQCGKCIANSVEYLKSTGNQPCPSS
ncbi:MAG: hypothetical protein LBI17_01510 [Rickettsiales bacterium]|jgi:hypothetical protein|nr:hypothetical protein [Rickettsiales bacterium]